jgi:GNAT superfamily N-acetyltransferase
MAGSGREADVRRERADERKAMLKLLVRPVTMADRPAVMRISSRIWEGRDYVPMFFDRWVSEGGFWAVELRNRLAGYGKATELAAGEWWLEGLRVDPDCRSRGVGKELSRQVLYRTLENRPVSLRLATADVNRESIHIIEKVMGFKPYAQYRFFLGAPGRPEPGPKLVQPTVAETLDFLRRSAELAASRGLLQSTWRFRDVNRALVAELKRGGYLFGHRAAGRLAGLMVLKPHRYHGNDLDISFVAGTGRALAAFRLFLFRVAQECGTQNLSGMAASEEMAAALASLGMKPHPHNNAVLVYDYSI